MHSAGLELMKEIYTRLEDNMIPHQGDRLVSCCGVCAVSSIEMGFWVSGSEGGLSRAEGGSL